MASKGSFVDKLVSQQLKSSINGSSCKPDGKPKQFIKTAESATHVYISPEDKIVANSTARHTRHLLSNLIDVYMLSKTVSTPEELASYLPEKRRVEWVSCISDLWDPSACGIGVYTSRFLRRMTWEELRAKVENELCGFTPAVVSFFQFVKEDLKTDKPFNF